METSLTSLSALALLGLGFVFGLKHATEVDHVVAVSTIVSKERNIFRSALVGGLWGIGHTASLVIVGAIVLVLRVAVPERVSNWLEFCVALMIIGLGLTALIRALRGRSDVHLHEHTYDGGSHVHLHFHEKPVGAPLPGSPHLSQHTDHANVHDGHAPTHSHAISKIGLKPLLVGAMHGLAGSATLTLLVLTQINSIVLGLLYLAVFGIGSIFGMLLMSGLIGLPFAFSARRVSGVNNGLQTIAGALSIAFGLWYAYQVGSANGFWSSLL
jgi:ABC-type nickel/cobalt efflux system permease component RcnA